MTIETVSTNRSFGGTQGVYKHSSRETGTPMVFSVFVPDHGPGAKLPSSRRALGTSRSRNSSRGGPPS